MVISVFNTRSPMSCFRANTGGSEWFSEGPRITQQVMGELARVTRAPETRLVLELWEDACEYAYQASALRTWVSLNPTWQSLTQL